MASPSIAVLDDRLLIEELLVGLPKRRRRLWFHTTIYWYYRACRAATAGAGGYLSGPFLRLSATEQQHAILGLLELRDDVALPDPRATVPAMADLALRHPRLNVLNLEAAATARVVGGTLWLSEPTADGILPSILDEERLPWTTVRIS